MAAKKKAQEEEAQKEKERERKMLEEKKAKILAKMKEIALKLVSSYNKQVKETLKTFI